MRYLMKNLHSASYYHYSVAEQTILHSNLLWAVQIISNIINTAKPEFETEKM